MPNQRITRITTDMVLSERGRTFSPIERHPDDSSLWRVRYSDGHLGIFAEDWLLDVANSVPYGLPADTSTDFEVAIDPEPSSVLQETQPSDIYIAVCNASRAYEDAHAEALQWEINDCHFSAGIEYRQRELARNRIVDIDAAHALCLRERMPIWHDAALSDEAERNRPICPGCQVRYRGRLGRDHRCPQVANGMCTACNIFIADQMLVARAMPLICPVCIAAGYIHCRKCTNPTRPAGAGGSKRICAGCHPARDQDIWDVIPRPIGDGRTEETQSTRTFAVEVETVRDFRHILPGTARVNMDRFSWSEANDGSVRATQELIDAARAAAAAQPEVREFRSPPYVGDGGLYQMMIDIKLIRDMGFRANNSCGVHVHVDGAGIAGVDRNKRALFRFGKWYEDDMYRLVDPSRRANSYCRPLPNAYLASPRERYHWLNLAALTKHGTVEYRLHHGCTIPSRITEWAKLCLKFTEAGIVLGQLRSKPALTLAEAIGMTAYEKAYWAGISANLYPPSAPPVTDGGND